MTHQKRILLATTGGDCPGLNAVISGVVLSAEKQGIEVYRGQYGFESLLKGEAPTRLHSQDVRGLISIGGTLLGASNHSNPFNFHGKNRMSTFKRLLAEQHIAGIVCIGGEGSLEFIERISKEGIPSILIPKTIDNDLPTEGDSIGFWSAVQSISDAVDALRATAESHHRVMLLEVMGRKAGYLALYGGIAGGADAILIPECFSPDWKKNTPHALEKLAKRLIKKRARSLVIVLAEGVKQSPSDQSIFDTLAPFFEKDFHGTRSVCLGHVQRGASPHAWDRVHGPILGAYAVSLVVKNRWNRIVVNRAEGIGDIALNEPRPRARGVSPRDDKLRYAREMGILFGDE